MNERFRVAVVGAGITGLTAAYRLGTAAKLEAVDLEIEVFESDNRAGGAVFTSKSGDRIIEHGPDSILSVKPAAIDLIEELGMQNDLIPTSPKDRRSLVAWEGKLHALPEGFVMLAPSRLIPFIQTPLFSLTAKLRMALELVSPGLTGEQDETVETFALRRFGREALAKVVQPMVGGIYVGDVAKLSAQATLPQFIEMERKHGSVIRGLIARGASTEQEERTASGARYSMFVSLKNGIQSLTNRLEEAIGSALRKATAVRSVERAGNGRWLVKTDSTVSEVDAVILATPARVTASLLQSSQRRLAQKLSEIEAASAAVVNLLYKRDSIKHPLDGFGFVVPTAENRSILAASFISNKFPARAADGFVAVRVFMGGVLQSHILEEPDSRLVEIAQVDLAYYLGVKSAPQAIHVMRFPHSMPQYNLGHRARVNEIMKLAQERMPGVFLAGNSYHGVGIPDCIASAQESARAAIEYVKRLRTAGYDEERIRQGV